MKRAMINYHPEWTFWLPDSIADWDAITHWERERLASMQHHLELGDVLYDIGVEHGWLSAVYGGFCGHENMVLVEPSPEFWPNIRKTWQWNGFPGPIRCYQSFAGVETRGDPGGQVWPDDSDVEAGGMAYRYIDKHLDVPSTSIDWIVDDCGRPPDALTIDVEGAELLVLQGASMTLRDRDVKVWVSVHWDLMERDFGHTPDQLHEYMTGIGYEGTHIHTDHEAHWYYRKPRVRR